jgi:hypothetical protein
MQIREYYKTKQSLNETVVTSDKIKKLRGIVRSDIDEKAELEKSRKEKYVDLERYKFNQ